VLALGRWGSRAPFPAGAAKLGVDAFVLALKTLFDPSSAGGLKGTYELRLGEDRFHARVSGKRLDITRDSVEHPDAVIEADTSEFSAVLWHGRRLGEAVRKGDIRIQGSRPAVEGFFRLFPAPKPACAA
jgi:hypothetical protein